MSVHYPENFSYLEIFNYNTQSLEIAIDRTAENYITKEEDSSHTQDAPSQEHGEDTPDQIIPLQEHTSNGQGSGDSHQLQPTNNFSGFRRLPTELQREVLLCIARPLLEIPRIVEIHEATLGVRYLASNGDTGAVNIKHFRSKTPIPPIFNTCYQAREVCWSFFDQERPLGNELCPDTVLFSFERDAAYFTKDTIQSWCPFWGFCCSRRPEYPLGEGAGRELRASLKRMVFDMGILVGRDMIQLRNGHLATGNGTILERLGPGLLAFPALEEITLVVSTKDADVHFRGGEYRASWPPITSADWETFKNLQTLDADRELSSMTLVTPELDSTAAEVLQEAAGFLAERLDWFFNGPSKIALVSHITERRILLHVYQDLFLPSA